MFLEEWQAGMSVLEGLVLGQRFGPSRALHTPGSYGALSFRHLGLRDLWGFPVTPSLLWASASPSAPGQRGRVSRQHAWGQCHLPG